MKMRFQEYGCGVEDYNDDSRGEGGGLWEYSGGVDQRFMEYDGRVYVSEYLYFLYLQRDELKDMLFEKQIFKFLDFY